MAWKIKDISILVTLQPKGQHYSGTDSNGRECLCKKKQIMDDLNDDELVLSSFGVVLEVNERGKNFYKIMRDIVERTYRCTFHLKYIN